MHPMSSAVAMMVTDVEAAARRTAHEPIDPAELEHYTHDVLRELARSRPRVIDYLPELALNQVLALLGLRQRSVANQDLAVEAAAICRTSRQDCWPVPGTGDGKQICRCTGRTPAASAWNARLPWRVSIASRAEAQA
jgi:hypothetical protein